MYWVQAKVILGMLADAHTWPVFAFQSHRQRTGVVNRSLLAKNDTW